MANFIKNIFTRNDKLTIDELIFKKTIYSFFFFFLLIGGAIGAWGWLQRQPLDGGIRGGVKQPLKEVLYANESVFEKILPNKKLAKEYPKSAAVKTARVNGNYGLEGEFDPDTWELYILKAKGDTLTLKLEDIKKLPKSELVFNFKCIEGWSEITWWGGVRFADFIKAYGLNQESAMKYIGLSTPDEEYYVGIDMASALHPQTLLCYELNGQPLPMNQGYPLRLIIPVKYGVKSLKRIGSIYFDNERPPDFWSERGYDYYTGL